MQLNYATTAKQKYLNLLLLITIAVSLCNAGGLRSESVSLKNQIAFKALKYVQVGRALRQQIWKIKLITRHLNL